MADYQRVIEFLRDVRQGGGGSGASAFGGGLPAVTAEITQMAAEYAALCTQANERLRQCSAFLQQGLRSEAIHLAEQAPNLLDLVAQLDLPDPGTWAEFCQNNGLAAPPPLQLERAAMLNEAYSQEQPLEHLLARHRLLALARAPVRERLDVLRKIAQLDPGASYWEKDIRVLEQARLKELPTAFYGAVKDRDEAAIGRLMDEINIQHWHEPVPTDLSGAVSDAYGRMQRLGLEGELRKLIEPLRDAYAARSLQECQALVQRWKNTMAAAGVVTIAPDLLDEIKPVIAFIAEQGKRDEQARRFKDACKGFSKLLDSDAPDAQLEAGYAKLKETGQEIPEELTRRYTARKTGRRREADRRHKVRLMAIGGFAALLVIVSLAVLLLLQRAATERAWAGKIEDSVRKHTREDMQAARGIVDGLQKTNPGMLQTPAVAAAVRDLEAQQAELARDSQTLQGQVDNVNQARKAAAEVAGKNNATLQEMRTAALNLQAAEKQAQAVGEKVHWADSEGKLPAALAAARSVLAAMQDRVASDVRGELASISAALVAIPGNPTTPEAAAEAQRKILALADRLNVVRDWPLLNDEARGDLAALTDRIAKLRQGADASGAIAAELENIRLHAVSALDLKDALDAFIQKYPNDPRAAAFRSAIKVIPAAQALEAWDKLVGTFEQRFAPAKLNEAQARLDKVNEFLAAYGQFPKKSQAEQYADYLRRATEALAEKGTWQSGLSDLLGTPLLSELAYMEVSDGRRYFTLGDVKRVERRINDRVSVTFEALDVKDLTKRVTISVDPPKTVNETPIPMAHTRVIADIADSLKLISESNWDTYGIDLADRIIRNDQVDMIVKAILLRHILKTEVAVSGWALGDTYDKVISDLDRQQPDKLPWLDAARITEGTRQAIKQAIDEIPPPASVKQKVAAAAAALFKSIQVDELGTGVLLKDDAGAWTLNSKMPVTDGSVVWAIAAADGEPASPPPPSSSPATNSATQEAKVPGSPAKLLKIGGGNAGKYELKESQMHGLPEGTIVYITRP